jgi:hypothetical protein
VTVTVLVSSGFTSPRCNSMPVGIRNGSEIIDLTNSSPEAVLISDDDDHLMVMALPTRKKRAGTRKTKRHISEDGDIGENSAQTSRDHSIEPSSPSKPTCSQNGGSRSNRTFSADVEEKEDSRIPKGRGRDRHSRDQSPQRHRRSYSPQPRRRDASPSFRNSNPFFIDVEPTEVKPSERPSLRGVVGVGDETPKLLLPVHVSVFSEAGGAIPVEILPPKDPEGQDYDYIEYLDYDDRKVSSPQ